MSIHLHPLLKTPILNPYRELAKFGLTTESSQIDVNKIDLRASFEIEDKSILVAIRQPNWRIRIDFFCFPFASREDVPEAFLNCSTLDQFADEWLAAATEDPNNATILHRLACYYQSHAWEQCESHDFDGMFSTLSQAIPCWVMLLNHYNYINQWRDGRYQVYGSKNIALMFADDLIEELAKTIDIEIKKILQHPEVTDFSNLRSAALFDAFERELLDLKILDKIGGLQNKSGNKVVCGPLGIKLFRVQVAACKRADALEKLHPTPQKSYLCNIEKDATADEKLAFNDVQNFRMAFFELGEAFFNKRRGKVWQAFADLSHLVGAESMAQVDTLEVPHGSLLYLPNDEGLERFQRDFWYLAAEIAKLALSLEVVRDWLDYDQLRRLLRRIVSLMRQVPNRDELVNDMEEMFLGRHYALLESKQANELYNLEQGIRLLEIFMTETQQASTDSKVAKAIASAAGNLAAMLANRNGWDQSIKYFNRCLELAPDEFTRISEAVYVYEQKIRQTFAQAEKISYYKMLLKLLKNCAPHHEDNREFEEIYKATELNYHAVVELDR